MLVAYSLLVPTSFNAAVFSGEHLWPRSYGLTDGPSMTDIHNIRPADVNGKMGLYSLMSI